MKKKFLSLVHDPLKMLAIAGISFGIAMIDSVTGHAASMGDLSWWGKLAIIPFLLVLTTMFVFYMLIPVFRWLFGLNKK